MVRTRTTARESNSDEERITFIVQIPNAASEPISKDEEVITSRHIPTRTRPMIVALKGSEQPNAKKARTTGASASGQQANQSYDHVPENFAERDEAHLARYSKLATGKFKATRFGDVRALKELGVYNWIVKLLQGAKIYDICFFHADSYTLLTREFMSSIIKVPTTKTEKEELEGDHKLQVRLYNQEFTLTEKILNSIFCDDVANMEAMSQGAVISEAAPFDSNRTWKMLTGQTRFVVGSKASSIHSGMWRIIHKLITNVLFSKSETGGIYLVELQVIACIMEGKPINLGKFFIGKWAAGRDYLREFCMGGLISLIAQFFGFPSQPKGYSVSPGDTLVDLQYLANCYTLARQKNNYFYRFKKTKLLLPLPKLVDYDNEKLVFTEDEIRELIARQPSTKMAEREVEPSSSRRKNKVTASSSVAPPRQTLSIIREVPSTVEYARHPTPVAVSTIPVQLAKIIQSPMHTETEQILTPVVVQATERSSREVPNVVSSPTQTHGFVHEPVAEELVRIPPQRVDDEPVEETVNDLVAETGPNNIIHVSTTTKHRVGDEPHQSKDQNHERDASRIDSPHRTVRQSFERDDFCNNNIGVAFGQEFDRVREVAFNNANSVAALTQKFDVLVTKVNDIAKDIHALVSLPQRMDELLAMRHTMNNLIQKIEERDRRRREDRRRRRRARRRHHDNSSSSSSSSL